MPGELLLTTAIRYDRDWYSQLEQAMAQVEHVPHYKLTFRLPIKTRTNASDSIGWRRRKGETGRLSTPFKILVVDKLRPEHALQRAAITCIRYSPQQPDYDGLVHSFKYVLDLLHAGKGGRGRTGGMRPILVDDTAKIIGQPRYEWRQITNGVGVFIEVRVEDRPPWVVSYR